MVYRYNKIVLQLHNVYLIINAADKMFVMIEKYDKMCNKKYIENPY